MAKRPPSNTPVKLPYFDYLLGLLERGNNAVTQSFGRHVHWGYWQHPKAARLTADDFAEAAEQLSAQLCLAAGLTNGLRVLDVGCGFGGTIAHINENYTDMDLVGFNLDERQLARARTLVLPLANNRVQFLQGNACALPFADQSVDVVLAVECIFHFPSRLQFFNEAFRVLKPGGYLALSDFIPIPAITPLLKFKRTGIIKDGFYGACNLQYTAQHYQQLASSTGFEPQLCRDITENTLPTYRYLRRLSVQQRIGSLPAALETAAIEFLSRMRWVKYVIYAWQKPEV